MFRSIVFCTYDKRANCCKLGHYVVRSALDHNYNTQLHCFSKIFCLQLKQNRKFEKQSFTPFQILCDKNNENKEIKNSSSGSYCVSNWELGIKRTQNAFLKHSNDHHCNSNSKSGWFRENDVICTQNNSVNKHFCDAWMRPTDAENKKSPSYTKTEN